MKISFVLTIIGWLILVIAFQNCSFEANTSLLDLERSSNVPLSATIPQDPANDVITTTPNTGQTQTTILPIEENSIVPIKIEGFPHDLNLFEGLHAERAIVFLHGGGGGKDQMAYSVELNNSSKPATLDSVDWEWLNLHKVVAVFPQGQHIAEAPSGNTWSNHAMLSGQDDVAFLKALSKFLRDKYRFKKIYLAGHSMGSVMTNRIWCEASEFFDAYIGIAGPASTYYSNNLSSCAPNQIKPYFGIIGSADSIMQDKDWTAENWLINPIVSRSPGFENPYVISEWQRHIVRSQTNCQYSALISDAKSFGKIDEWSNCGNQVRLFRILGADHGIEDIQTKSGLKIIDMIVDWVDSNKF